MDEVAGKDTSTHKIAKAMGNKTSASSVNRWRTQGTRPNADKVIAFARGYDENPVIGLILAGYLSDDEVRMYPLATAATEDLLAELRELGELPPEAKTHPAFERRIADIEAEMKRRTQRRDTKH